MMDVDVLEDDGEACEQFVRQRRVRSWPHARVDPDDSQRLWPRGYYLVAREQGGSAACSRWCTYTVGCSGTGWCPGLQRLRGPLAADAATQESLYGQAVDLARRHGCECIEFRNVTPMPFDLHLRTDKVAMHLAWRLTPGRVEGSQTPDPKPYPPGGEGRGHRVPRQQEILEDFYQLWTVRMHELGTPCYSRELFACILETFPEQSRIFLARCEGRVVAGFRLRVQRLCPYAVGGACESTMTGARTTS